MRTFPRHRLASLLHLLCLVLFLMMPGCEIGRSWFTMSSDSPSPWFGFDLLPRRRTTQVSPQTSPQHPERYTSSAKTEVYPVVSRSRPGKTTSQELHLPSIPPFFERDQTEELSFTGPEGAFSR